GGFGWIRLNSGTTNNLSAVAFIDDYYGVVVGEFGTILRTTNGGLQWTDQSIRSELFYFYGVDFLDSLIGIVVGTSYNWWGYDRGLIYYTSDGGGQWLDISNLLPFNTGFYDVEFIDTSTVVVLGASCYILLSTDRGQTWNQQTVGSNFGCISMSFTTADFGLVVGGLGGMARTNDGGITWDKISRSSANKWLVEITFTDTVNAYAVGESGTILHTTDCGRFWGPQQSGVPVWLNSITFVNPNFGFVSGDLGTVLQTSDGGINWHKQITGTTENLWDIFFINFDTGFVVGNWGTILRTTNHGETWTSMNSETPNNIYGIHFIDQTTGMIVGRYGEIQRTTNCGVSWQSIQSGTSYDLAEVFFLDKKKGWIVGGDYFEHAGILLTTTNSGISWNLKPISTTRLKAVFFIDSLNGCVVGDYGTILRTTDGGVTWVINNSPTNSWLSGVYLLDSSRGFIIGGGGTILTTGEYYSPIDFVFQHNFVQDWNMVTIPIALDDYSKINTYYTSISPAFTFEGIYSTKDTLQNGVGYWLKFSAPNILNLIGKSIVLDTIDVNAGWNMIGSISYPVLVSSIKSDPPGMVTTNFFTYLEDQYVISDTIKPGIAYWVKTNQNGKLILDTGITLNYQYNLSSTAVEGHIKIIPDSELPPAPPEIEIVHTTTPTNFVLHQNYPNPFNPSTAIRYQIPFSCWVTLKVYNVLGQEVATLVDESASGGQDAGFKSINWNTSNIPSGVYYYKLKTEKFTQVRKMLLIQ
ncbi:MAG: T9SS type A sorting domain-containing protein, partial [Ignavibacteriales bacterium]|nr:T9SS type A sorting domain-containing protein [Ignavibacteriales bacterium]